MSEAAVNGLFTLGVPPERYRLPHDKIDLSIVFLVRKVLVHAFEIIRGRGFSLVTRKEDEITAALRAIVETDLRQTGSVNGFNRRTFETVVRQGQVVNYSLTKLTKAPDLCFKLRNDEDAPRLALSEHEALFAECKPIDKSHAAGGKYCDDGLCRFVDGDYAWAMEQALMVGYVRHGRTIEKHLIPAMKEPARNRSLKVIELPRVLDVPTACGTGVCEALHTSRHRRGFQWPDGKGAATDIVVYHSWHSCE
jgi:hypothetical protein